MGYWGLGVAQSEDFCDVYDEFMEEYNNGMEVPDISEGILADFHQGFEDTDGVLHDVYFALAKAEWMCCQQSERILSRVDEIIKSDANLEYYKELGADSRDLKLRKKKLLTFWNSLQTPRKAPRKRYRDPLEEIKPLPPMEPGDCFAYKYSTGYRVLIILDRCRQKEFLELVFCCILKKTFQASELDGIDFLNEEIGSSTCYTGREFLGKTTIKKINTIKVPKDAKNKILGNMILLGDKTYFKKDFSDKVNITLGEYLKIRNMCEKLKLSLKGQQIREQSLSRCLILKNC